MSSAVQTIAPSVGGRFLLLGCADGLKAYQVCSKGAVKKIVPDVSETKTSRGCHPVGGPVRVVAVLGETPLVAFALEGGATSAPACRRERAVGDAAARDDINSSLPSTSRVLCLHDLSKNQTIAELHFETAVVGIQMNCRRLAVALVECIHIFDLKSLQHLAELRTTSPPNPAGLFVLSDPTTNAHGAAVSYIAFPQTEQGQGDVSVVQVTEEQVSRKGDAAAAPHVYSGNRCGVVERELIVNAHHRAVVCLAMTRDGSKLATASERGTTVKVFDSSTARLMFCFRRGLHAARMLSLSFDPSTASSGQRLAALSSRGTLHVFRCPPAGCGELMTTESRLPCTGSEMRSFAQVTVGKKKPTPARGQPQSGCGVDQQNQFGVHCCFFSKDEPFVWVVLPVPRPLEGDAARIQGESGSGGAALVKDRDAAASTPCWILQQYSIHMHVCELVNSHVLN